MHPPRGLTLRRFRPTWPACVTLDGVMPAAVEAEGVCGAVRSALGPYQLSGDWWRPDGSWAVETWQVELSSGAIYQLARTAGGWAVEGVLD